MQAPRAATLPLFGNFFSRESATTAPIDPIRDPRKNWIENVNPIITSEKFAMFLRKGAVNRPPLSTYQMKREK